MCSKGMARSKETGTGKMEGEKVISSWNLSRSKLEEAF